MTKRIISPPPPAVPSGGITPAALIVVLALAVSAVALTGTTCWLYIQGDTDAAKDCAIQALGAGGALGAILSRTKPDAPGVTAPPADPFGRTEE